MADTSLQRLVSKYGRNLPRYTSYPTAVELARVNDDTCARRAFAALDTRPLSLYVHVPFCRSLCRFCACNKVIAGDSRVADAYLHRVRREMELLCRAGLPSAHVADLHLGGGSPTFLEPPQLAGLLQLAANEFSGTESAEKSIELDPRTTSNGHIEVLRAHGFSRASLGIQDFEPAVQEKIHRIQPFELVAELTARLRDSGFTSLNFDLIYGLPGQTELTFMRTLRRVLRLRPDRIALYGYAHVSDKVKVQRALEKFPRPEGVERIALFVLAERVLTNAGYCAIGLDHFALETDPLVRGSTAGTLKRTFMGYTTSEALDVLGLGPSAISDISGSLMQNETALDAYYAALDEGRLPLRAARERTREDLLRGEIIQRIMCDGGVRIDELPPSLRAAAAELLVAHCTELRDLSRDGILHYDESSVRATYRGRLFLRTIAAVFDAYIGEKPPATFSAAV